MRPAFTLMGHAGLATYNYVSQMTKKAGEKARDPHSSGVPDDAVGLPISRVALHTEDNRKEDNTPWNHQETLGPCH
jgi:hypothetical protein